MNFKEIKDLIELLKNTDVVELEFEKSGTRVRLRKDVRPAVPVPSESPSPRLESAKEPIAPSQPAKSSAENDASIVTSPIVGTFYRAPAPDADPYVEIGDRVKKGQILCIVEAMKLMNEIESELDGRIEEILVENAHPVEFGEPLFRIAPLSAESA